MCDHQPQHHVIVVHATVLAERLLALLSLGLLRLLRGIVQETAPDKLFRQAIQAKLLLLSPLKEEIQGQHLLKQPLRIGRRRAQSCFDSNFFRSM